MRGRVGAALCAVCAAVALCAAVANGLDNGVALVPPMGWVTWCTNGDGVIPCLNDFCNETEVMSVALAMATNGMRDAGYVYVNLDDCWAGERLANGSIRADTSRFPSGSLAPLADYVHSLGMRLGLYTDVGETTCKGGRPGSWGYYQQDAATYALWGIDYVKMDWCDHPSNETAPELYGEMRDALNATGRPMVYSVCEWGLYRPWLWGPFTANLWRVGPDHLPLWWTPPTSQDPGQGQGTANVIEHMAGLSRFAGPGAWNDPDFLMTGLYAEGLVHNSAVEWTTEFSFWALFAAPLIVSSDVRELTDVTSEILLNTEVIAVNQDSLAEAGDRREKSGLAEVWSKPLANSRWAAILYNNEILPFGPSTNVTLLFDAEHLPGWQAGAAASVRDLWAHEDLGTFQASFTAEVAPHACRMLLVSYA